MPPDKVHILLVDDRTDLISLFGDYLSTQKGYAVERVPSSREGIELLFARSYSLVISNDSSRDGSRLEAVASSRDIPLVRLKNERKRRGSSQFTL